MSRNSFIAILFGVFMGGLSFFLNLDPWWMAILTAVLCFVILKLFGDLS
jgi:VIT1/CCC1 family predicted Fe2+/Mn2+ transporter